MILPPNCAVETDRLLLSVLVAAALSLSPAAVGLAGAEPDKGTRKRETEPEHYSDGKGNNTDGKGKINAEASAMLPRGVSDEWKKRGMAPWDRPGCGLTNRLLRRWRVMRWQADSNWPSGVISGWWRKMPYSGSFVGDGGSP